MGIEYVSGKGAVAAKVLAFQKRLEKATTYVLNALGEDLVKYAKEQHNYTDQSGNLTNSIGYVVVQNGTPIRFGGLDQQGEGSDAGLKLAMKLAAETPNSFSLIIVAGMDYAAYVESKGYNVILPAELKAKSDFPAMMNKLIAMARTKANELFGDIV